MTRAIHRSADLRSAGFTDDEVRRKVRSGVLARVRRGVYADGVLPDEAVVRHRLLVRAAVGELDGAAVVSHVSAAALHGLDLWSVPLRLVTVTRNRRRSGGRVGSCVHVRSAPLPVDDIAVVDGIACTSPARTVVDLGRVVPFEQAVVITDAALRAGLDTATLAGAIHRAAGWRGVPAARRAAAFADPRAASVGESRSRVALARAGLPAPELQLPVQLGRGTAYCDFGWPAHRTVGEFDGKVKYGRLLRPGLHPGDAVYEEKLREDAIRARGWEVVRWTWADLHDFTDTAVRIRARLGAW